MNQLHDRGTQVAPSPRTLHSGTTGGDRGEAPPGSAGRGCSVSTPPSSCFASVSAGGPSPPNPPRCGFCLTQRGCLRRSAPSAPSVLGAFGTFGFRLPASRCLRHPWRLPAPSDSASHGLPGAFGVFVFAFRCLSTLLPAPSTPPRLHAFGAFAFGAFSAFSVPFGARAKWGATAPGRGVRPTPRPCCLPSRRPGEARSRRVKGLQEARDLPR